MDRTVEFREAMARVGAAVSIVTTDGPAGRYGLTVTAVCSVSAAPPMMLLCINRASKGSAAIQENGRFAVNVLMPEHRQLAQAFADSTKSIDDRFAQDAAWVAMANGVPRLSSSAASIGCDVSFSVNAGTHCVIFGAVQDVALNSTISCLSYFDRSFHALDGASRLAA